MRVEFEHLKEGDTFLLASGQQNAGSGGNASRLMIRPASVPGVTAGGPWDSPAPRRSLGGGLIDRHAGGGQEC